ncbi:MAG: hypothetical protein D9C04_06505 [Nitrosopumilus sp. B06]|nr:MAG: hypothetical protein EB828_03580 [Nitrosopumilus sp. D6]RNJ78847.1 MAG: hypothetical protein D9C04_06505 [Nitrosopumilus sp. B06]
MVAGYFDPDYGNIFERKDSEEIVESMIKNHDNIYGGTIMVPLVKFRLFDTDLNTSIFEVEQNVSRVSGHLAKWKDFLSGTGCRVHSVRISHTDQDMLTIAFPVAFSQPTPLEKNMMLVEISPILNRLQESGLL